MLSRNVIAWQLVKVWESCCSDILCVGLLRSNLFWQKIVYKFYYTKTLRTLSRKSGKSSAKKRFDLKWHYKFCLDEWWVYLSVDQWNVRTNRFHNRKTTSINEKDCIVLFLCFSLLAEFPQLHSSKWYFAAFHRMLL